MSFAEYHSKRNFVQRVHAAENEVLSKDGPFDGKKLHPHAEPWSSGHKENMEAMATEVLECLQHARFGGRFLHTGRGVKTHQFLFDDVENLITFLSLTEERKVLQGTLQCSSEYDLHSTPEHMEGK